MTLSIELVNFGLGDLQKFPHEVVSGLNVGGFLFSGPVSAFGVLLRRSFLRFLHPSAANSLPVSSLYVRRLPVTCERAKSNL